MNFEFPKVPELETYVYVVAVNDNFFDGQFTLLRTFRNADDLIDWGNSLLFPKEVQDPILALEDLGIYCYEYHALMAYANYYLQTHGIERVTLGSLSQKEVPEWSLTENNLEKHFRTSIQI